jgi:hypothetical protein
VHPGAFVAHELNEELKYSFNSTFWHQPQKPALAAATDYQCLPINI